MDPQELIVEQTVELRRIATALENIYKFCDRDMWWMLFFIAFAVAL